MYIKIMLSLSAKVNICERKNQYGDSELMTSHVTNTMYI